MTTRANPRAEPVLDVSDRPPRHRKVQLSIAAHRREDRPPVAIEVSADE